jgi:hypothetical protein
MEIKSSDTQKFKIAAIEKLFLNQCKKNVCLITLVIIFLHIQTQAQTVISKSISVGDTWLYGCTAQNVRTDLRPQNGTLDIKNTLGNIFSIQYRPNAHFIGLDSFYLNVQKIDNQGIITNEIQIFKAEIAAPRIQLKDDFGQISANQTITLNPLANDVSDNGILQLRAIPLVNHGTATIINNQIQFTPKLDFKGVTHIHYLACLPSDTCATAQMTLYVSPETLPQKDTICVYTFKNQPVTFVAPIGLELNNIFSPQQGVAFSNNSAFTYIPSINFAGKDSFELQLPNGQSRYMVFVFVINQTAPPQYLHPDVAFTTKNSTIISDVLVNDYQDVVIENIGQVTNGEAILLPNGNIQFIPQPDFEGVATVEYLGTRQGVRLTERGILTIIVHNFMPTKSEFRLTAVAGVPLKMRYPAPITHFHFDIVNSPQFGILEYQANTNTLIYTSRQNATNDVCLVRYQVGNESKLVRLVFDIVPSQNCTDACTQIGDANGDGVVDMHDLSTLAQHLGTMRNPLTPQNANWQLFSDNGTDLKNADLNADGIINAADTSVLSANLGRTYQIQPILPTRFADAQLHLVTNSDTIYNGDMVEFKISLGSENQPAMDIKGFNFSFEFEPNQVNRNSLSVNFQPNKWLKFSAPTLELTKQTQTNRIEAAIVQASGRTVKGHGEVGAVRVVIVEDLCCFYQRAKSVARFAIKDATLIDSAGNIFALPEQVLEIPIKENYKMERVAPLSNADLWAFPNPTNGVLQLHLNGNNALKNIKIFNMLGQQVLLHDIEQLKAATFDISHLPKGFYLLEVNTLEGRLVKKINKL